MVKLVQFMLRASESDHGAFDSETGQAVRADAAEFCDNDAVERTIVEETVQVDR